MTIKKILMAMVFSVAILGGYQAYEQVSLTSVEAFLLENVEALTEEAGEVRESHKALVLTLSEHKKTGDYEFMDCDTSGDNNTCKNKDHLVTTSTSECCQSSGMITDSCKGPLCP